MKKVLKAGVLSALAVSLAACGSGKGTTESGKLKEGSKLVVDAATIKGNFMSGFGNTNEDKSVKTLLNDKAGVVYVTGKGELKVNKTYVKNLKEEVDSEGNKTFTIELQDGLKWSDGEALTAKDYVFAQLFYLSDEYASKGASIPTNGATLGEDSYKNGVLFENFEAFQKESEGLDPEKDAEKLAELVKKYGEADGENGSMKGLKLVNDTTFTVTIKKDKLPYFYELSYIDMTPLPMHVLAKGADIKSDDNGVSVTGVKLDDVAAAVVDKDGYLHKPTVSAGPYMFESFENNEVILKANPNYAGDSEGRKPTIERVILKGNTNSNLAGERLLNGDIDLLPAASTSDIVKKLEAAKDKVAATKYDRLGFGYLGMAYSDGPTKDLHVRKGIAHMTDRQALISSYLGAGNGVTVNGEYGAAQWMYIENKEALSELDGYDFSLDEANKEFDQSEYRFQKDGTTPWTVESGNRYNANGEELVIKHFTTENNPVSDFLKSNLAANAPKVGMKYEVTAGDWNALIDQFYFRSQKPVADRYSIFNLATGFTAVYDPSLTSHSSIAGSTENPLELKDAKLDELMDTMKNLDKEKRDEYSKLWLDFQKRFNEILPILPLYSNVYRDYYTTSKVEKLPTTPFTSWDYVIEQIVLK